MIHNPNHEFSAECANHGKIFSDSSGKTNTIHQSADLLDKSNSWSMHVRPSRKAVFPCGSYRNGCRWTLPEYPECILLRSDTSVIVSHLAYNAAWNMTATLMPLIDGFLLLHTIIYSNQATLYNDCITMLKLNCQLYLPLIKIMMYK